MKTNASEYFSNLSPLKDGGNTSGSAVYEGHVQNGRSGRCHCCPYGYHIDLDFVRYCDMLTQGSKNDSPTLRQLKKLKRARRRQTKSMEVLLGLSPGKENADPDYHSKSELEIIEEPNKFDSMTRNVFSMPRRSRRERTPPPPPPRRCTTPIMSPPPPDVISTVNSSSPGLNVSSKVDANEALQEAMLDFEEMLESSREKKLSKGRSETLPPNIPSLDLLNNTPSPQHHPLSPKLGTGVSRSHSLPRQLPEDSPLLHRHQRTNSTSSISSTSSVPGCTSSMPLGAVAAGSYAMPSYGPVINNGLGPPGDIGIIQQHAMPPRLSETLAVFNAARGCSSVHSDFDTMSVTSAMSGVSTTTLQSIRDQMATSLNRLKELEEEVKSIPVLQIKLNVLKEEKRLLLQQLKSVRKGEDVTLLLPPSLDGDLTDLSEDELEGRLMSLKSTGATTPRKSRKRSESPMRVNLEDFRSYRRARRGSVSEGSEAESVRSVVEDTPLFIKEAQDYVTERRRSYDQSSERRTNLAQDPPERRLSQSSPSTPAVVRKSVRDASTNCRVLTRDIGVTHVGPRTRSVGLTTDRLEIDKKKEIKAKPCMQCYERNRKKFENKGVGTPSRRSERYERLSLSSVSLESIDPEENDYELRDHSKKDESPKNAFLQKLGRKSAIISRLSEPQLAPPVLTFDNSTNTEPVRTRDERVNTNMGMTDLFTKVELDEQLIIARRQWESAQEMQAKINASLKASQKPLTIDCGTQVAISDPSLNKTTFQPLMQNASTMVKPLSKDMGVGLSRITDIYCDKCANIKTRSVGSGDSGITDLLCDKCSNIRTKSVAVGDYRISDVLCEKCSAIQTKSVGISNDKITDRICDRCDNLRTRSVAVGGTISIDKTSEQVKSRRTSTTYVQTKGPDTRTTGVNTMPLNFKKEDLNLESNGSPIPSPALTPEVERRSYGSSGVRICDKCHETIQSVAKDIVNTSGTASGNNLPPLPPHASKIPRLVDINKVEPRLDLPRQEPKSASNLPLSYGSSLSESQISSLSSSFIESKPSTLMTQSLPRAETTNDKVFKLEPPLTISSSISPPKHTQTSVTSTTAVTVLTKSASVPTVTVESKSSKLNHSTPASKISDKPVKEPVQSSNTEVPSIGLAKATVDTPVSSSSSQSKRVPYTRQQTYTKFPEGVINLGFDENADAEASKLQKDSKKTEVLHTTTTLTKIAENEKVSESPEKAKPKHIETKKEAEPVKKATEPEPVIQGRKESQSSSSSSESDNETCDEESLMGASICSQTDAAPSSFQSASSLYTVTSEKIRKKSVPSREMKAALKVLNDSIGKPVRSGQQLTNAINIIQREWFKVSSQKDIDPHAAEDYMDVFEAYSKGLLQRVVNLSDVNGNTAMHYAVSHGNFDVVSILLDSKVCNVNQQNKAGYTATMLVSLAQIRSETHASVVQRLFQLGDVNIKASQHGQTALMLAVSHGRLDMVRLLVAAGSEINIQDEDGSTALMCAAEHGHLGIVKFLLGQPDTDPTLMDNDGSTALTIAVEAGHKDVGVLLYKHMNLSRGSSPYSSIRIKRSRTPTTINRSSVTPPPRSSAPSSPGRSRKSSAPVSPGRSRQSSASLSNLMI